MLLLIYRQLRYEGVRTTLTILAIGAVIAVILVLEGFLAGIYAQLRTAVLNRSGDLIVTQAGIGNFIAARSILPQLTRLQVEDVDGVQEAHPLTGLPVIYGEDGQRTPVFILVYDTSGGPNEIVAGETTSIDRGIVIDSALATKYDLKLGDPLIISDFEFVVSGVSTNSAAFFTPFAFIAYDDLIDFYFESEIAADISTFPLLSFLLVDIKPGADARKVAQWIEERVPEADVYLPEDLAQNDENLGRAMLGPVLGLLLIVSYIIGVLVVGMFMFAAVRARFRNLGVLRALGLTPSALARAAFIEATILTAVALVIGVLLAHVIASIVHTFSPVYLVLPGEPMAILRTAGACLVISILGTVAPVRSISQIEPAIVFRS